MSRYISTLRRLSHSIFSNEFAYKYLRILIAGNQDGVKDYVREHLQKYAVTSVVDICCGTGDFVDALPNNVTYLGYDSNANYIRFARSKYKNKNVQFLCEDVLRLKKLKKHDATLLISTMHHFGNNDMQKLLSAIKQSSNILIVADLLPNPPSPIARLFVLLDRGNYIRPPKDKIALLRKDFDIIATMTIKCGWAYQYCIVAKNKNV